MRDIHDIAGEWAERLAPRLTAMMEREVRREYGDRCPDTEEGCPCCDAWAFFDQTGICPTGEQLRDYQQERRGQT